MSRNTQNDTDKAKAARAKAAKAEADRTDARGTVSIACRLPTGLRSPLAGHNKFLDLKGANDRAALLTVSALDASGMPITRGGHGITTGVKSEDWAYVQEHFKDAKWLKSGAVFSATKKDAAIDEASEREGENVGFNGIDGDAPGRKLERGDQPIG